MPNSLVCKIKAIIEGKVDIEINGQSVVLPIDCFPEGVREKDYFQLFFLDNKNLKVSEKKLAKIILEEILNGK